MNKYLLFPVLLLSLFVSCKTLPKNQAPGAPTIFPVQVWTTTGDQQHLLESRTMPFVANPNDSRLNIQIDTAQKFQSIDGFGFTLTGGSAFLLHRMAAKERAMLLQELFGQRANSIALSYLRISVGASDLDAEVFSYDDLPAGATDPELKYFNLSKDKLHLIPILKEILAINPHIKLMGSPWSPPAWMKTNNSSKGGSLKREFYPVYAQYLVKYLQSMVQFGITFDALTLQNEPQNDGNNPSMLMSAAEEADFVKNHLGPALHKANLPTKIIIWDHNCDHPEYPLAALNDAAARNFIAGTAFHLYGGDISALSQVHDTYPDKALYFTEQWTSSEGQFDGDLRWHMKNVIIGSMRNWSRVALEWNLANSPDFGPHTPGGCTQCRGALTIDGSKVTKNVSYYIIGQAAKCIPPGSVRLASNEPAQLPNVAFRRPDGKTALIVLNDSEAIMTFQIHAAGYWMVETLAAGAVATLVW